MGYEKQDRGNTDSYAQYFAGMDKSMRQKIALITSYFPFEGRIADMGSGSGKGSYDLAALYPALSVIGIDINQKAVELARDQYQLPNLAFSVGDVAERCYPKNTFDGILNSSVLHHVTSFNGFARDKLYTLLDSQAEMLREGGILAIRDFVAPETDDEIILALPNDDGDLEGGIEQLSTAALFKIFLKNFRSLRFPEGNISSKHLESTKGWSRYLVSRRVATEFVLHKDYRRDWSLEIQEEYTYFSQSQFEKEFSRRGLRIIFSRPIYNPWIVKNRFEGKFEFLSPKGERLPYPPTNYIIVGAKHSCSVALTEIAGREVEKPNFLEFEHWDDGERVWDLIKRPKKTIDIVPWFLEGGELFVFCREGYPRPIVNALNREPLLDGSSVSGFIIEPLAAIIDEKASFSVETELFVKNHLGFSDKQIGTVESRLDFLPSPGGISERIVAQIIELQEVGVQKKIENTATGFLSPARVQSVHAIQTLRAYQVGGMFDARLEAHIYDLLLLHQKAPGPWIGAELPDTERLSSDASTLTTLFDYTSPARVFSSTKKKANFLAVRRGNFAEKNAAGDNIREREFEYVIPQNLSSNTIVCVPFCREEDTIFIGLEQRLLPAAASQYQDARLLTFPAWRLPKLIKNIAQAEIFGRENLQKEFGINCGAMSQLGGSYYPSVGVTPEVVTLFACGVQRSRNTLIWLDARIALKERAAIRDGHFLTGLFRIVHAARGDNTQSVFFA